MNPMSLFFRITSRLFAIFMDFLGRLLRSSRPFDPSNTFRKRLLVVRQGGLGDLLFISAVIAELKRQHPWLKVDLMCHPQYHGAFYRTDAINSLVEHRWPSVLRLIGYDYFVFLDGVVECDPEARTTNIYDLLAGKHFGITMPPASKIPDVRPTPHAVASITSRTRGFDAAKTRIGLQPFANSPVRTPSAEFWVRTCAACLKRMPEASIFIIAEKGRTGEVETLAATINSKVPGDRVHSAVGATNDAMELATLVSLMDAAIAPDSSVAHLAAAFGVPAISVYGPFPSRLRTRDYPLNSSINAAADCAPCFTHGHWPCREARKAGVINSPCFDRIPQAAIDDAIETLAARIRIHSPTKPFREYAARQPTANSETSKFKGRIVEALALALGDHPAMLNGVEVGTGGAPLISNLISVDLPIPYTKCGTAPIQLKGDGKMLRWFADESLDYLYSSHLFEDFGPDKNGAVLDEWLRVLRPGGVLALLLPEQPRYLRACARKREAPNEHHVIATFGPEYMAGLVRVQGGCKVLQTTCFWESDPDEYNFLLLLQKNASGVSTRKPT